MHRLPDLAFGNAAAELVNSSTVAAERMGEVLPSFAYLDQRRDAEFLTKSATRTIGGIALVASAVLPSQMQVEESGGWHMVIPVSGRAELQIEGQRSILEGGTNAILLPNIRRTTTNETRSAVIICLSIARLEQTLTVIDGPDGRADWITDRPREMDLRRKRELFPSFQNLCRLIDATSGDPQFADQLGIEDMLYRWMALVLGTSAEDKDSQRSPGAQKHRTDLVCDLILSTSERTITLSEMERASGLSARALQYAFRDRFGCSPMEWQRRQRIALARDRLISAAPGDTITSIAHALGFCSSAAFAARYKQHFGISPSEAIRARS